MTLVRTAFQHAQRGRAPWTLTAVARLAACVVAIALVLACGGDDAPVHSAPTIPADGDAGSQPAPVARVETADAWLDLLAQRPNAVVVRGETMVVDLGSEAARKHVALGSRHRWRLAQQLDGRFAGIVVGRGGSLDLPLDGPRAPALHPEIDGHPGLAMAITVRALTEKQSMTVLWNERPLAHLQLTGDAWQRRTLSIPTDLAQTGENRLRLHFRRTAPHGELPDVAAAVATIEVGAHATITGAPLPLQEPAYRTASPPEPGGDGAAEVGAANLRVAKRSSGAADGTLWVAGNSALAFYVVPPTRAKLVLDVRGEGGLRVQISTDEDHAAGRDPTALLEEPLRPTGRRPEVDLTAWGGRAVRLEIGVHGEGSHGRFAAARIVARRSVPVDRRARKPRDVIVLAVEGARSDALEIGRRPPLPHLDDFVAGGLAFDRAYALSPAAVPSHAAWLTSVAPPVHLTIRGTFIAAAQTLLPEALGRSGYRRVAVTANSDVNADRGLLQGIDKLAAVGGVVEENSATAIADALLEALNPATRGLVFALANVNDPQAPYEPPRELLRDSPAPPGAPLPHHTHIWVGRVRLGKTVPGEAELGYIRRLYRGELQIVDKALGRVMDALRETGRLEEAIVVFVGVHGEEFFEHAGAGHGRTLYEESLRVPLVIHAPQLLAPGHVSVPVDLLDLAPTLADLTGIPPADSWQGESLVPVIDDPQPPPRLVVAYLGDGSRAGLVGDHKVVLGPGGQETYFDLGRNAAESPDRQDSGGVGLRMVRSALTWQLRHEARWRRARWGTGANLRPAFANDLGM